MTKREWIVGTLGFLTGGPLGAIAGIVLERFNVSSSKEGLIADVDKKSDILEGQRNGFQFSLVLLSSYIIQADHQVLESETDFVINFIKRNYGDEAAKESTDMLFKIMEERKKHSDSSWKYNISKCCYQLTEYLTDEQLNLLVGFLINLVKADKQVADEELACLYEICDWLHVSQQKVEELDNEQEENLMNIYENIFEFTDLF